MRRKRKFFSIAVLATVIAMPVFAADPDDAALAFDPADHKILNINIDGAPVQVRHYRVVYVAKPIKMAAMQPAARRGPDAPLADVYGYQTMNIYVPQNAYSDPRTAIILQVNNGGWFKSLANDSVVEGGRYVGTNNTDNTGAALKAGYVVINAGTRSRGALAADGTWQGKAPAVIVDAKAAVRYLRLNDIVMSGSAERIIITGTSGGGGLSVAVAASGNSPDYFPYLAEIGAAGIDEHGRSTIRDDVFATVAYCPINDLGHADLAYEWQYNRVRSDANTAGGKYPADMQAASKACAEAYPGFLASLNLKMEDGVQLTADNMDNAILAQVKREIYEALKEGAVIPAFGEEFSVPQRNGSIKKFKNSWLAIEGYRITKLDYQNFLKFVTSISALKAVVAFDSTAVTGNKDIRGENTLFGPVTIPYVNFTEWAWNNNEKAGDGTGLDDTGKSWGLSIADPATIIDEQVKMVSPLPYLNTAADAAPYWYVRHGVIDRDIAFASQIMLYYAILNDPSVKDLSFELAWLQGHGGNYDVQEAYAWVADVLAEAGDPLPRGAW